MTLTLKLIKTSDLAICHTKHWCDSIQNFTAQGKDFELSPTYAIIIIIIVYYVNR